MLFFLFFLLSVFTFALGSNIDFGASASFGKTNFHISEINFENKSNYFIFGGNLRTKKNEEDFIQEFSLKIGSAQHDYNTTKSQKLSQYVNLNLNHIMFIAPKDEFFSMGFGYGMEYYYLKFKTEVPYTYTSGCTNTRPCSYFNSRKIVFFNKNYFAPFINLRVEVGVPEAGFFLDFQQNFASKIRKKDLTFGFRVNL